MILATLLLALVGANEPCNIPTNIHITSPTPCFVMQRIEREWPELEARVRLVRQTLELPYTPVPLSEIHLDVVEHPEQFTTYTGDDVLGVYSNVGEANALTGEPTETSRVDYSRLEEQEYRVLLHEMGHYRYDIEQLKWSESGGGGWFMHGNDHDPALQAINILIKYLWPIPTSHPYWPGLLGESAHKGTFRVIHDFICEMFR